MPCGFSRYEIKGKVKILKGEKHHFKLSALDVVFSVFSYFIFTFFTFIQFEYKYFITDVGSFLNLLSQLFLLTARPY